MFKYKILTPLTRKPVAEYECDRLFQALNLFCHEFDMYLQESMKLPIDAERYIIAVKDPDGNIRLFRVHVTTT